MPNHSSTSSSEPYRRRWIALALALGLVLLGEAALLLSGARLLGYEECILRWKMDRLDRGAADADVLLLGASRVVHGLVPREMEEVWGGNLRCVNLGINGCPVETLVIILDEYLEHHPPPVAVLASVVPLFLGPQKPLASGFEVRSLYRFSDVAALGAAAGLDPWLDWIEGRFPSRARLSYLRQGLQRGSFSYPAEGEKCGLLLRTPGALWSRLEAENGYVPFVDGTLEQRLPTESAYWNARFNVLPRRLEQLSRLEQLCSARDVPLCLFATPEPLSLFNRNSARGYNRQVSRFWERTLAERPALRWVGPYLRAQDDDLFADWWCHPTERGARAFSRQLAEEVASAYSRSDLF
jgi:hypothetical protein